MRCKISSVGALFLATLVAFKAGRAEAQTYRQIRLAQDSSFCLGVPDTSTSTSNQLQIYRCDSPNNGNGSLLRWWQDGDLLRLEQNSNRCLSRYGSNVILQVCDSNIQNQWWSYNVNADREIKKVNNNMCMQYSSISTGTRIQLQTCDGGTDQEYIFENGRDPGSDTYKEIRADDDNDLCIGAPSNANINTELQLYVCDSNNDLRLWRLDGNLLRLKRNPQRCAARNSNNDRLRLESCDSGNSNQRWTYSSGSLEFENNNSGRCMQYDFLNTGSGILVLGCNGETNQRWNYDTGRDPGSDTYEEIRADNDNDLCIGAPDEDVNTELQLYLCSSNNDLRLWRLDGNLLRLKRNPQRCAARNTENDRLWLESCNSGNSNQRWTYNSGRLEFENDNSGRCMQYNSLNTGSRIDVRTCNTSNSNQRWIFGGAYREIQANQNNIYCIGAPSANVNTELQLYTCGTNNDLRLWKLDGNLLRLKRNSQLCAARDTNTGILRLESCNSGSSNQRWTYNSGNLQFENNNSGRCMEYTSLGTGSSIFVPNCNGLTNQEWRFSSSSPGPPSPTPQDGEVIFLDSSENCNDCIGVSSTTDRASLVVIRCDSSSSSDRDRMVWNRVPATGGSHWCLSVNTNLCVVPSNTGSLIGSLELSSNGPAQILNWFYNDADNPVNNDITNQQSDGVCVERTTSTDRIPNAIRLQNCDTSRLQSWRMSNYDDQEEVCVNQLELRDPTDTSTGSLIYVNSQDDCDSCIGVAGCSSENYNCPSARLEIVDCSNVNPREVLIFWNSNEVPSASSLWCLRDARWCVEYRNTQLQLVDRDNGLEFQGLRWDFYNSEITTFESSGLCVAQFQSGTSLIVEECSRNIEENPKTWTISNYLTWDRQCLPDARNPDGSRGTSGMYVVSTSNCNACIGVSASGNIEAVGCGQSGYFTTWKSGKVPGAPSQWCLDSDPTQCIKYDGNCGNDYALCSVSLTDSTSSQDFLWYFEDSEITPQESDEICLVRDGARIGAVVCNFLGEQTWQIVPASGHNCMETFSDENSSKGKEMAGFVYLVSMLLQVALLGTFVV